MQAQSGRCGVTLVRSGGALSLAAEETHLVMSGHSCLPNRGRLACMGGLGLPIFIHIGKERWSRPAALLVKLLFLKKHEETRNQVEAFG